MARAPGTRRESFPQRRSVVFQARVVFASTPKWPHSPRGGVAPTKKPTRCKFQQFLSWRRMMIHCCRQCRLDNNRPHDAQGFFLPIASFTNESTTTTTSTTTGQDVYEIFPRLFTFAVVNQSKKPKLCLSTAWWGWCQRKKSQCAAHGHNI